jgi:hypothetical protein
VFQPDLAMNMTNLALQLRAVGLTDEAREAAAEAKRLAADNSTTRRSP